jgi:hypothetical protein
VHRHPWRRLAAWCVDWGCILGWAALVAAVAVPLLLSRHGSLTLSGNLAAENLVAFAVTVAPVTAAFAVLESRGGTLGKRLLRIAVRAGDSPPPLRTAVVRNVLKLALPWTLGHLAVFELVATDGTPPGWVVPVLAAAYAVPVVSVVALFRGAGRTPYDALAGTRVEEVVARQG